MHLTSHFPLSSPAGDAGKSSQSKPPQTSPELITEGSAAKRSKAAVDEGGATLAQGGAAKKSKAATRPPEHVVRTVAFEIAQAKLLDARKRPFAQEVSRYSINIRFGYH